MYMYVDVHVFLLFASALRERDKRKWWHGQGEALHRCNAEPGIRNLHHGQPGTELIYLIAAWAVRRDPRIRVIL